MEIKILQVFYDKNGLPYKDKERTVHYPITSGTFLGASNTTQIRFYYDQLDELNESTFVAVSKLPNGKIGSEILENEYDSELQENYAVLNLSQFYTQYKGDVYISLQGYQGGVRVEQDEDGIYQIYGTPTIQATGSIRMSVAYAPTFIGSGETENITLQRVLAELSTKLGIRQETLYVEELPTVGNPNIWYVINDDPNDTTKANIYIWNATTQTYVWVGDNTLDLGNYYTQEEGQEFENDIDNRVTSVENELSNVASGSPKGVYATLAALQAAYPTGTTGIYVVSDDGHWYYWNGTAWTDGGVYLSTADAASKDELKELEEKIFNKNLFENSTFVKGRYLNPFQNVNYVLTASIPPERCISNNDFGGSNEIIAKGGYKVKTKIASGYKYVLIPYRWDGVHAVQPDETELAFPFSFFTEDKIFTLPTFSGFTTRLCVMVGKTDDSEITPEEAKAAFSCSYYVLEEKVNENTEAISNLQNDVSNLTNDITVLQNNLNKTGVLKGRLSLPDTYNLPFDVIKTNKGYYPNVSIEQLNNEPVTIYITVSSTNTGLGTNEDSPITLYQFKQNIINDLYSPYKNYELVFIDKLNIYSAMSTFDLVGTGNANVSNITIRGKNKGTWIGIGLVPTWEETATDGIYKFTSSIKISDLCDLENVSDLGMPNIYAKKDDVASVIATVGSFCQNSSNVVYIHPYPNNDLSKIVALYGLDYDATNLGIITIRKNTSGNVIFKDLGFLMDTLNVRYGQTLNNNLWFFNCKFHRGSQDALGIDGLYNAYLVDCVADYASKDNFNYHGTNKDIIVAEFNCLSYGAGKYKLDTVGANTDKSSNNGSTAHNGMTIMRFGCCYWECEGAIIADVHNCKTLNVDCVAKNVISSISVARYNSIFMLHDNRNAATIYRPNDNHTNYIINCGGIGATNFVDLEGMKVIISAEKTNIENNYITDDATLEKDNILL